MKNKILIGLTTLGVVTLLLSGCSKVPQTELDSANSAIEAAKTAGADLYVPDAYAALQDSMKVITEKIELQKTKIFRKYGEVKKELNAVTIQANQVSEQTEVRKTEVKTEVQNALAEVKTILQEDKQLITKAPRGKEGSAALLEIKNEINIIEGSVDEASKMLEGNQYIQALDKVKAAKEKASSINAELKNVIAKYSGAKR
jgi:hypothetical protein